MAEVKIKYDRTGRWKGPFNAQINGEKDAVDLIRKEKAYAVAVRINKRWVEFRDR